MGIGKNLRRTKPEIFSLSKIRIKSILFNNCEYQSAFSNGVMITLDSPFAILIGEM